MPRVRCLCNCSYVPTVVCSGQTNAALAPRVYILAAAVSATTIFSYGTFCYTVAAGQTPTFVPKGAVKLAAIPGSTYADCAACTSANSGTGSGSSGGGGPGGGSAIPGGGGGPGSSGVPDTTKGYHATACDAGAPDVWIVSTANETAGTHYFRYSGFCYSVVVSGSPTTITGGTTVTMSGSFASCADCKGGVPLSICGGQSLPPTVKQFWIRTADLPAVPEVMRIDGVCMLIDPGLTPSDIPPSAAIIKPASQYASCETCTLGATATVCDGNPAAPVVWVPQVSLPTSGSYVWKYEGYCYSVASSATLVAKPEGAIVQSAKGEFASCGACACGDASRPKGIMARVCANQGDDVWAKEYWIAEADIPAAMIFFIRDGICYSVDPSDALETIPTDKPIIEPAAEFLNCWDCVASRVNGNTTIVTHPKPPAIPPPPTPTDGDPNNSNGTFARLRRCDDGTILENRIPNLQVGQVAKVGGVCYEAIPAATGTTTARPVLAGTPSAYYWTCANCSAGDKYQQMNKCADGSLDNYWIKVADWVSATKRVWSGTGGGCWYSQASNARVDAADLPAGATIFSGNGDQDSCDECCGCGDAPCKICFEFTQAADDCGQEYPPFYVTENCTGLVGGVPQYDGGLSKVADHWEWSDGINYFVSVDSALPPTNPSDWTAVEGNTWALTGITTGAACCPEPNTDNLPTSIVIDATGVDLILNPDADPETGCTEPETSYDGTSGGASLSGTSYALDSGETLGNFGSGFSFTSGTVSWSTEHCRWVCNLLLCLTAGCGVWVTRTLYGSNSPDDPTGTYSAFPLNSECQTGGGVVCVCDGCEALDGTVTVSAGA